eukprot:14355726-Heterocapsa_arctica.AAC.1
MESAENEKLVYELRITKLTAHAVTLSNEVKIAEFKAQFLQEAQLKDKREFDNFTFDLEVANMNLAKAVQEQEQMQIVIDSHPAPAINGEDQVAPVDRDLFNQLVCRCKEVNDEVRVLHTQLAESK